MTAIHQECIYVFTIYYLLTQVQNAYQKLYNLKIQNTYKIHQYAKLKSCRLAFGYVDDDYNITVFWFHATRTHFN